MNKFNALGLSGPTIAILNQLGFDTPTHIQKQAIPFLMDNDASDFIGIAQTGTGKTAAYGLPLVELTGKKSKEVQALVMAPTRELGRQIASMLSGFTSNAHLRIEVVYGGVAIYNQVKALKKPVQIIVATPGRLLDLIRRKAVKLQHVRYVVLDEADEMLNMGFKEDIDEILSHISVQHATWLFSATMPEGIRRIATKYMRYPFEVIVNREEKINRDIVHQYAVTKSADKIPAVGRFLDHNPDMKGILFCRTRRDAQRIAEELMRSGYAVEALHGDLSQAQRDSVMKRFKSMPMQLLIATDVAARGIDVNNLTHVIHHTLPEQSDYYTHRSGRTARIGKKGISLVLINTREGKRIKELEKKKNIHFELIEVPGAKELKTDRLNKWAHAILHTEVTPQTEDIYTKLSEHFSGISKEELLKRLISDQLIRCRTDCKTERNLNEKQQTKITLGKQMRNSGYNRYFINIGLSDGMNKPDILRFLSDVSGIKRKYFGYVNMQKNCTYFYLSDRKDKGFSKYFFDMQLDKKSIRIKREDEGNRSAEFHVQKGRKRNTGYKHAVHLKKNKKG